MNGLPREMFEAITQSAARNARVLAAGDPDELDAFTFLTTQHPFVVAMTCVTFVDLLRMAVEEDVSEETYVTWLADKLDLLDQVCEGVADAMYNNEEEEDQ